MKKLIDYKEEIHKCSKCGMCQSVCPVYKITGNDCSVSRGKFIMLNGIIKGDLKLNSNINKHLDMCLKCNACKDFCPSNIDARKIFLTAKSEYFNKAWNAKFLRILHSKPVFNLIMNCTKIATNIYRFLGINIIVKRFYPILQKFELGKKLILANELVSILVVGLASPTYDHNLESRSGLPARQQETLRIMYFKGCVNEYINPRTKIAAENILKQMGVNVINTNFQCCGVPFLSSGNVGQFIKQAEYNLAQIPDDFEYFLTDCASCQNAFKEYENYIEDTKLLEKIKKINQKSINIVDFIVKNAKSFEFSKKTSFTFHKPCHLENIEFIKEFLLKAKNIEYIEMKDFDKCCGFSGEFAVKNPEISQKISAEKIKNALDTKAGYVLTSCPACILGLTQGMIEAKKMENEKWNKKSVYCLPFTVYPLHFIEFLAQSKIDI
jgi:Fe-S oxidoreductase